MNVGDLVRVDIGQWPHEGIRVGVVTGFDEDNDPIVCYYDQEPMSDAFYRHHVEVISENS